MAGENEGSAFVPAGCATCGSADGALCPKPYCRSERDAVAIDSASERDVWAIAAGMLENLRPSVDEGALARTNAIVIRLRRMVAARDRLEARRAKYTASKAS